MASFAIARYLSNGELDNIWRKWSLPELLTNISHLLRYLDNRSLDHLSGTRGRIRTVIGNERLFSRVQDMPLQPKQDCLCGSFRFSGSNDIT